MTKDLCADSKSQPIGSCATWIEPPKASATMSRGALLAEVRWRRRATIPIAFLNGTEELHTRVMTASQKWRAHAKLCFQYVPDPGLADVRIAFEGTSHWSALGTSCKNIVQPAPTMSLGLSQGSSEFALESAVLHEFGHMLGFVHEHQSPATHILWDKPVVYAELKQRLGWTKEQVDVNVFNCFVAGETNFTEPDPDSIMLYPIPPYWTKDRVSWSLNSTLSVGDKLVAQSHYA